MPKEVILKQRKDIKRKKKIEERKTKKQNRYFNKCIAPEDIKTEEEEEELEDAINGSTELEISRRVLHPENDVQIIDEDMDYISDDESVVADFDDVEDSDTEPQNSALEVPRKRKISHSESNGGNDDSDTTSSKIRKRKSSFSSDVNDNLSISELNNSKGDVSEDISVPKNKRKKEKISEVLESTCKTETKRKKKNKSDERKCDDISSSKTEVSNGVKNIQSAKPTLTNPGFLWDIDPLKFTQV